MSEDAAEWQRLDKWLWCARIGRHRADCARLVEAGQVRVNRQPTNKPHQRLRVGDVLTLAAGLQVRVLEVASLAMRRGPASEAQGLYRVVPEPAPGRGGGACGSRLSPSYAPSDLPSADLPSLGEPAS